MPLGDTFIPTLEAEESDLVRRHVQPIVGVRRAVEDIVNLGIATCVASNGTLEAMRERLGYAGLTDLFADRLFSAEQVARGKPFPDVFLRAANTMGFPPSECVVVEDSEAGIQAGRAAGMRVLAYSTGSADGVAESVGVEHFADMALLLSMLGLQDPLTMAKLCAGLLNATQRILSFDAKRRTPLKAFGGTFSLRS